METHYFHRLRDLLPPSVRQTDRQTDSDRQTDIQTQTDRQRQTYRQTDRLTISTGWETRCLRVSWTRRDSEADDELTTPSTCEPSDKQTENIRHRQTDRHNDTYRHTDSISTIPTLLLTKNPGFFHDFPRPPRKIFHDLFGAHECLNIKKKNGIYLQYSECSPLQKIQHEARCGR